MTNDIKELQKSIRIRLNERDPQYPADTYFIKNNRKLLEEHVVDPSQTERLKGKATPR